MADNSYAQLIDDFEAGINVLEGETLTEYIKRMGGVDYNAHGGSVGIEVLFGPKRKEFKKGGRGRQDPMGGFAHQTAAEMRSAAPDQFGGGMNISHGGGDGGNNQNKTVYVPPEIKEAAKTGLLNLGLKKFGLSQYLHPALAIKGVYNMFKNPEIKDEDVTLGKTSEVISDLPSDNLFAEVTDIDLKRAKEPMTKTMDYDTYKTINPGSKISPYEFDELKKGNITETGTFTAADGGRVGFQAGGSGNWWDNLEGEAKGIYDSMTAYGASDAEIQSKLQAQNLWSPDGTTTDTEQVTGIINQNIGGDRGINANMVDTTDYSFNKKNYGPGGKLEVNPEALGMSFFDSQPSSKKDQGFIESFMGAAVPSKQFSQFTSPGTGDVLKGPAEQGFMSQNIEGIPGNLTREDLRSMYDNYNKFTGRTSNYAGARVPGTVGNLMNMVPYMGTF